MIKSVSHTIGPSGYNVSLTALQEGMEIGPQPTVTATVIEGDLTPSGGYFTTENGRPSAADQAEKDRLAAEEVERIAAVAALREAADAEAAAERAQTQDTTIKVDGQEFEVRRGTSQEQIETQTDQARAIGSTHLGGTMTSSGLRSN